MKEGEQRERERKRESRERQSSEFNEPEQAGRQARDLD